MSRLTPTNRGNECPICRDESGNCRINADTLSPYCMTHNNARIGEIINGFKATSLTRDGLWMIFNPVDEQGAIIPHTPIKEYKKPENLMPLDIRDKSYRQVGNYRGLTASHRQEVSRRGLLPEEIDLCISQLWLFSWEAGISALGYPDDLCGVDPSNGIFRGGDGIAIARLNNGLISGLEIANDSRNGAKYYPLSSSKHGGSSPHLPNGELPISEWVHPDATDITETWITEGGLKSLITAFKLWRTNKNIRVIGIAGNNFLNHYKSIKPLLTIKNIFCPDAGMVDNSKVWENYTNFINRVDGDGFNISVAWWGQFSKTDCDIDELDNFTNINFINLDEFRKLTQPLEELNNTIKVSQPAQNQEKISQFQELKAIRHGLINITEVPYKVVNVLHLEQALKDVIEPGTINIIVSDTGTGKTESIIPFAKKADAFYSWHNRISLGQAIAKKLELDYKDPKSKTNLSNKKKAAFCAPSAYQFDPKHLSKHEGILLVDEADQVFDFLFGSLCNKDGLRPLLLSTLEAHVKSAIYGQGLCLFMSADITQKEIDLIKSLAPENTPVRLIVNKYQPQRPDINFDVSESPEGLLSELIAKLDDGVPCFVLDDMKNGVKGCKSLAEYVRKQFPELKDLILEIHADSQHDPKVKAFNEDPDEESKKYIMIICSPSIISGVSLKNQKFINGVFGFCNGILMDREIKQFLNRVRGAKDIYLWVSQDGFEPMGIPSELVNPDEIASYYQRNYEGNAKHLLSYKPEYEVMSGEWSSPYFKLFCKNQSYRSITAKFLRRFTKEHLLELGYGINEISPIPEGGTEEVKNALTAVWNNIEIKEALAIEAAEILPDSVMDALDFDVEIPSDMLPSYRKTKMLRTFGEELINATVFTHKKTGREFTGYAAMALKNARGEYQRHLDNFFLLSKPIEESKERDYKAESRQQKHGERFAGDVRWNARKRKCREFLGLHEFINPETIDKWLDPNDFAELASKAKNYPDQVREVLNLDVSKISPGQIFGQLMDQIGLGLDKKSVAGQKYKLRRINKQDYEYVQMYLAHKESLELGKVASIEPVAVVEPLAVAETSEDPLIPLIVDGFQSIKTIDEWDSINADITEAQMQSAWDALTQDVRDRISNLFIENRHEAHT